MGTLNGHARSRNTPSPNSRSGRSTPFRSAALGYACKGWRVLPLRPRGKNPLPDDWPNRATTDPDVISEWWGPSSRNNVGVAMGVRTGLVSLDVDSAEGEILLAELSGGDLPVTLEHTTGKGRRLLFRIPDGVRPVTTIFAGSDGKEALRLQSDGAQAVVPPSVHPNGKIYEWVPGRGPDDIESAEMPAWLVGVMTAEESAARAEPARPVSGDGLTVGADFNRRGDWWRDVLLPAGCKRAGSRGEVEYGTRPGKDAGVSFTIGHCRDADGNPALFNFSGSWPELPPGRRFDKFGAYTRLFHNGDFKAAAAELASRGYGTQTAPAAPASARTPAVKVESFTAAELLAAPFPEQRHVVDRVIPDAVTAFLGKHKSGKTIFSICLAAARGLGRPFLGREVERGPVVYYGLEDGPRRFQRRLRSVLGDDAPPAGLEIVTRCPFLYQGFEEDLAARLKGKQRVFVIVDTLVKLRVGGAAVSRVNGFESDYRDFDRIRQVLMDHNAAGLVLAHMRKMPAEDDWTDSAAGTGGMAAAADAIAGLFKKREEDFGTFKLTGRDSEDASLGVRLLSDPFRWELAEGANAPPPPAPSLTPERQRALSALSGGQLTYFAAGLLAGFPDDERGRNNARQMYSRLAQDGLVARVVPGVYQLSDAGRALLARLPGAPAVTESQSHNGGQE